MVKSWHLGLSSGWRRVSLYRGLRVGHDAAVDRPSGGRRRLRLDRGLRVRDDAAVTRLSSGWRRAHLWVKGDATMKSWRVGRGSSRRRHRRARLCEGRSWTSVDDLSGGQRLRHSNALRAHVCAGLCTGPSWPLVRDLSGGGPRLRDSDKLRGQVRTGPDMGRPRGQSRRLRGVSSRVARQRRRPLPLRQCVCLAGGCGTRRKARSC